MEIHLARPSLLREACRHAELNLQQSSSAGRAKRSDADAGKSETIDGIKKVQRWLDRQLG